MKFELPELSLDFALTDEGEKGGPLFLCRVRGCRQFRRDCGQTPRKPGGPIVYCEHIPAQQAILRRAVDYIGRGCP